MPISVKLDQKPVTIELKAPRTLSGDIMIFDHEDIDIVIMKEKKKCLAFPKNEMSDRVYDSQDRLYRFLSKRGIVTPESVQGGNVYGSLEAQIMESTIPGVNSVQAALFTIYEYLKGERPYFGSVDQITDDYLDHVLRPSDEHSTDLGDVPQAASKGSMDSRVRAYGYQYNYSLMRENKKESEEE